MWKPFKNMKGAARWVALLATALGIQCGLCSITPLVLRFAAAKTGDDFTVWMILPAAQLVLFLATLIALFIAILVALIQRRRSPRIP